MFDDPQSTEHQQSTIQNFLQEQFCPPEVIKRVLDIVTSISYRKELGNPGIKAEVPIETAIVKDADSMFPFQDIMVSFALTVCPYGRARCNWCIRCVSPFPKHMPTTSTRFARCHVGIARCFAFAGARGHKLYDPSIPALVNMTKVW